MVVFSGFDGFAEKIILQQIVREQGNILAVETCPIVSRPVGFSKLVLSIPSSRAVSFILATKSLTTRYVKQRAQWRRHWLTV
jgi:hypothetical protein